MKSAIDCQIFQPRGLLSTYVQGIWSVSVAPQAPDDIKKWLYSDAGSGVLFNLTEPVILGEASIEPGTLLQPISKQAQSITLVPGAQLAGFRFHPAIGYGVFGKLFEQPTCLQTAHGISLEIDSWCARLQAIPANCARIAALYRWLIATIDFSQVIPRALSQALDALHNRQSPGQLSSSVSLGQRQIERQFQRRMGMTPKYYQRILRVKNTLDALKQAPNADLVDLALCNGFTDQAHMTREFACIARITPKRYSNLVVAQGFEQDRTSRN